MTTRTVFITGGNRGIGRAIAEKFIAAGHRTAITVRQPSGESSFGALELPADVTDADSLQRALAQAEEQLGPVEVVVANAGITKDMLLMRMREEDFSQVIDTNLTGAWRLVKAASASMIRKRFGRIIFISSVSAGMGAAGQVNYSASKSGMIGMARALTRELGARGITSNVVAPGVIDTDMTAVMDEQYRQDYQKRVPLGRFGLAEEVAEAVLWLASDKTAYVSGAVIPVDGGLSMGL